MTKRVVLGGEGGGYFLTVWEASAGEDHIGR